MKSSDPKLRKFNYYFGLTMVIVYVLLGSLFILWPVPLRISRNSQVILGAILIVYGLARGFFRFRKVVNRTTSDHDETLDHNL